MTQSLADYYKDPDCPNCHGEGIVTVGEFDEKRLAYCLCVRENIAQAQAESLAGVE